MIAILYLIGVAIIYWQTWPRGEWVEGYTGFRWMITCTAYTVLWSVVCVALFRIGL